MIYDSNILYCPLCDNYVKTNVIRKCSILSFYYNFLTCFLCPWFTPFNLEFECPNCKITLGYDEII